MRIQLEFLKWKFPSYRRVRWTRRLLNLGVLRVQEVICDRPDSISPVGDDFEVYELEPSGPLSRLAAQDAEKAGS